MEHKIILREYLDLVRKCKDAAQLHLEFAIYDNFGIAFYGDTNEILPVVRDAFLNSPKDDGLQIHWYLAGHCKKGEDIGFSSPLNYDLWSFRNGSTKRRYTVHAYVRTTREGPPREFNGRGIAEVSASLHPAIRKWKSVEDYVLEMKPAVLDIGEFILRKGLMAEFTRSSAYNLL